MKKRASTFFAFLCLFLVLTGLGTSTVESAVSADIYGKVLRLHVIANSDSDFDQKLKLKVRDGILGVTQELFSDCKNVDLALETANKNIKVIEDSAKKILLENGFFGNVKVVLGKEMYPPKKYGSFTFPKGEYLSVRVLIGEAAGKNCKSPRSDLSPECGGRDSLSEKHGNADGSQTATGD